MARRQRTRALRSRTVKVTAASFLGLAVSSAAAAQAPAAGHDLETGSLVEEASAGSAPDLLSYLAPVGVDPAGAVGSGDSADYQPSTATLPPLSAVDTSRAASPRVRLQAANRTVASSSELPDRARQAYQVAAATMASVDPRCRLDWTLLAGIGSVESDHGRYGQASLDDQGAVTPAIRGVALNGRGVARITDSDAGDLDGDARWDRAVGPMQFLPTTWAVVGVDADGDGERDPDDLDDAALAAAVYLCAASDGLDTDAGASTAVFSYNHSDDYVRLVLARASAYAAQPTSSPDATPVDYTPGTDASGSTPAPTIDAGGRDGAGQAGRRGKGTGKGSGGTRQVRTTPHAEVLPATPGPGGAVGGNGSPGPGGGGTPEPPVDPGPTDPVDPGPTDPVDPGPTEPVDPGPTDPEPVDPEPVDPGPTEPVEPAVPAAGPLVTMTGTLTKCAAGGASSVLCLEIPAPGAPADPPAQPSAGDAAEDSPSGSDETSTPGSDGAAEAPQAVRVVRLDFGDGAHAAARARSDFDRDGTTESNAAEVAGLVAGESLTQVGARQTDRGLQVVTLNARVYDDLG